MNVKKQLLIAAGLAGSVVAGQQAANADQVQKHTVAAGETLSALASRFNTTVAQLAKDNQIQNVDQIYQGQELIIGVANNNQQASGQTTQTATQSGNYRVQSGDTLWSLSKKFGVSVDQLAQQNNIKDANQIFVGQSLQLTGASQTTAQPAESQASSQAATQSQAPASQAATSQASASQSQAATSQAPASQAPASQAATQVQSTAASQSVQTTNLDYDQAEQQALQTIIMKESGGNVNARNGIYFGIGQLSPTLRARYGGNSTDYQDQLQAMKAYIQDRYGSAQAALAHHLQYNWY
ncbi:hypothetical protein FPFC_060530 [Fructobacillus pseudoficulneus]|uniref:Uncharacterized protein n=1 Tax=Fructobacillus pseudoficulneus TaxID=220714 RepID=A0A3F3HBH3_9LACO|nr:LysM peptidoglycan-binding domain-containing protein [Fructobacillus pseudoficulneus]GAP03333.1 hypothetical protein FPFC_060530 [Fructobacillus pseudoficulneus]SEH43991.1 LysM domain-containing protein [Fructobacillus pseudoficulneus]